MAEASENKRRFPRYHCEGDTRIRPHGGWQALGNALSQISQGGCYIQTTRPYPEGTELELELDAGEHPIHVRGVVIYTHESRGMGVVFQPTSEEEQSLRELLDSMDHSSPQA